MQLAIFPLVPDAAVHAVAGSSPAEQIAWIIGLATVFATLIGPILAVQAQKVVEGFRERQSRKLWVFTQLMMTRQQRLSAEHVRALNLIDITFYGHTFLGFYHHRSAADDGVIDAWKVYLKRLSEKPEAMSQELWVSKHNESFFGLLRAMATATNFKFGNADLESGSYSPMAFANREADEEAYRKLAIQVLKGEQPLSLSIKEFPAPNELGINLFKKINSAISEDGVKVSVTYQINDPAVGHERN